MLQVTPPLPSLLTYIVLHRLPESNPFDAPEGFRCEADDADHAEEQCLSAYPSAEIVWVVQTSKYVRAIEDYYSNGGMDEYA